MPALLNPRHEKFARKYIELKGNGRRAYKAAGYNARMPRNPRETAPVDVCASQLLKRPKVKQRITELAMAGLKRHEITLDTIINRLDEDRNVAIANDNASAAVSADMSIAKLCGMVVEQKHVITEDFSNLTSISDIMEAITRELGPKAALMLSSLIQEDSATNDGPDGIQ